MSRQELLTVAEFCAEFKVSRSTLYEWLAKKTAPRCRKLPNGQLRFSRSDVEKWFNSCEVAA
ncbi:helix-turn-helix transcriptional regulator [Umezawaea beigongshangensis]|uniref:helix-turn-helix transcriptional regulator n=1 Tax=Umezawaea beigongshangensis TaxID=2780383 RepID=UPI0018F220FE|nr:helix-turn-helix domain-containing protein [Umezawaea beigongshangensis]